MKKDMLEKKQKNLQSNIKYGYYGHDNSRTKHTRKRKRRKSFGSFIVFLFLLICVLVTVFLGWNFVKNNIKRMRAKNKSIWNIINIGKIKRNTNDSLPNINNDKEDIYRKLKELAVSNSDFSEIYEQRDEYPLDLLNGLVHNTEMLEFVQKYFNSDSSLLGGLTKEEMDEKYPLFIQWDKRWGYTNYGDSLMGTAGCGPACLSMAVVYLTGNIEANPYEIAQFSYDNGYYVRENGTEWSLISEGSAHYGISAEELPLDESSFKEAIDQEKILILSMGPGHFTSSGHYIVIYDYNKNGFCVNDPNSYLRSEKIWSYSEFSNEVRNIWALSNE